MSKQSKRRRDTKRAKEAKARRRATNARRQSRREFSDAIDVFGDDAVDVMVIRSQSGRIYADGENIPLHDRVVLNHRSGVPIDEATGIADQLQAKIEVGEFPAGSRVTIMDSAWQLG